MEKAIYIYFGDNLFNKLLNFECKDHQYSLKFKNYIVFDHIKAKSEAKINEVLLGWSFIIFRIDNNYFHCGYFNSAEGTIEIFKDYEKELNIRCGVNKVFAFSKEGDILHYCTKSIHDVFSVSYKHRQKIRDLKLTDCDSFVLLDDGAVYLLKLHQSDPLSQLQIQSPVIEIACGKEHTLFLTALGQVYSFGSGRTTQKDSTQRLWDTRRSDRIRIEYRGQLGHGTIENQDNPMLLEALDGIQIKSIACGGWHSASISYAGDLYMWGWNESGQLGFPCAELQGDVLPLNEIETVCCLPKVVTFEKEFQIKSVSCGTRHTVILTEDNEVWSWGWNGYGQISHEEFSLCDKPHKISFPDKFIPKSIQCAFWSTLISGSLSV